MTNASFKPFSRLHRFVRHPLVLIALVILVIAGGAGAYWFQPWKLFTNKTVDEALPTVAVPAPSPALVSVSQEPVVVSEGALISHEHDTSGTVKLLRLPDASLVIRVENLETSNGPDVHVWLTDAPVIAGRDGWFVFDDGRHVDLGSLKGNKGTANYPVPHGVDVSGLSSVSLWCDRFDVSFGAAELKPVAAQ